MDMASNVWIALSNSFGLFYLIAFAIGVIVYAGWPSNSASFDKAARDSLDNEDSPWR